MSNSFRSRSSRGKFVLLLPALLLCAACFILEANAQVIYGTVTGSVTDEAGNSVSGAKVLLINTGTNQSREANTDANGNFIFTSVPGGTYSINVKKEGFQAFATRGLTV